MVSELKNDIISASSVNVYLENFAHAHKNFNPATPHLRSYEFARMIDHTLLKPDASITEIEKLCSEALDYNFASVCVNSSYVRRCFDIVRDSDVKVCSVVGFPLGASAAEIKLKETEFVLMQGASEVDMVINIGMLRSKDYEYVYKEIKSIAAAARIKEAFCKVIIETCLLTDAEKVIACLIAKEAGADFVKTSTGFSKGGAEVQDVALMKYVVDDELKVKASGGIKTAEDALTMISFGAARIGTSSGVKIIESYKKITSDDL